MNFIHCRCRRCLLSLLVKGRHEFNQFYFFVFLISARGACNAGVDVNRSRRWRRAPGRPTDRCNLASARLITTRHPPPCLLVVAVRVHCWWPLLVLLVVVVQDCLSLSLTCVLAGYVHVGDALWIHAINHTLSGPDISLAFSFYSTQFN